MIDEINISNIALINTGSIEPACGFTVITGETGAGKTALLTSCKLLMGLRADAGYVRDGQKEAQVSGRFFLTQKEAAALDGEEVETDADSGSGTDTADAADAQDSVEVIVQRRLSADGRSRIRMNGQMASVGELAGVIGPTIDLCSQHDQQMLVKPLMQRSLLDAWSYETTGAVLERYMQAFDMVKATQEELDRIQNIKASSDLKRDEATFVLSQIEPVDPTVEDYEELKSSLNRSENAESLARLTNETYCALSQEEGAVDLLSAAVASLDEGSRYDESLTAFANTLREASYLVEDVSRDVLAYRDAIDLDVSALEFAQERIAAYQGLMRKYGPTIQDVVAAQDEARRTLTLVDTADESLKIAQDALEAAESSLVAAAQELSEARREAAPRFCAAVNEVLARLEMGSAQIECAIERTERSLWTRNSPDRIEFLFRPAANMQARSLSRVASGGELSRIMLALHVVMGERDHVQTLVFDEIDAGVGGATARALAEVISGLATTHQVIAVTHLAQIASKAQKHYVVRKGEDEGQAHTEIVEVAGEARTREIARMLSGSVTDAALVHAEELLS